MPLAHDTVSFTSNAKDVSNITKNFQNPIKIVFADIDETILTNGTVPESAKMAIKRLKDNDVELVLATGRLYTRTVPVLKSLGLKPDYIITQHGAVTTDGDGNSVYEKLLSPDDTRKMLDATKKYQKIDPSVRLVLCIDCKYYCLEDIESTDAFAQPVEKVDSFEPFFEKGKYPAKVMILKDDLRDFDSMSKIGDFYKSKLKGNFNVAITTPRLLCEIVNSDASKGGAIKHLCKNIFDVDLKNAAVLGDAETDIDMVDVVEEAGGLTIAMGNSVVKLKEAAGYITGHINNDGFALAIDKIIENNERLKG